MKGLYEVEIDAKHKQESIYVRSCYVDEDVSDLENCVLDVIDRVAKKSRADRTIDSIAIYLCNGRKLLNIWEINVSDGDCKQKLRAEIKRVREYIKEKEA